MNNIIGVDKDALKMTLNALGLAGKLEVASTLKESCVEIDELEIAVNKIAANAKFCSETLLDDAVEWLCGGVCKAISSDLKSRSTNSI